MELALLSTSEIREKFPLGRQVLLFGITNRPAGHAGTTPVGLGKRSKVSTVLVPAMPMVVGTSPARLISRVRCRWTPRTPRYDTVMAASLPSWYSTPRLPCSVYG